ncbi:hypothetical protein D3C72_2549430 [compost metagenome]
MFGGTMTVPRSRGDARSDWSVYSLYSPNMLAAAITPNGIWCASRLDRKSSTGAGFSTVRHASFATGMDAV